MKRVVITLGIVALSFQVGAVLAAGDVQAGKAKAASCAGCHGANGEGKDPYPKLTGKTEDETVKALKEYKEGKRTNAVMKALVKPLSDQDMANLGAYYASLK